MTPSESHVYSIISSVDATTPAGSNNFIVSLSLNKKKSAVTALFFLSINIGTYYFPPNKYATLNDMDLLYDLDQSPLVSSIVWLALCALIFDIPMLYTAENTNALY